LLLLAVAMAVRVLPCPNILRAPDTANAMVQSRTMMARFQKRWGGDAANADRYLW
jgi:hypothetical protein